MKLWHKKRALTWPPELEKMKRLSKLFYNINSTPDGWWLQWL